MFIEYDLVQITNGFRIYESLEEQNLFANSQWIRYLYRQKQIINFLNKSKNGDPKI